MSGMSSVERGTIVRFAWARGLGVVRRERGGELEFAERVVQGQAAALEPDMAVWIEVGALYVDGQPVVLRLRLDQGERAPPWSPSPWRATPEQALAVLRSAGLATGVSVEELRAACHRVQTAALADQYDPQELPAFVQVDELSAWNVIAALASMYGTSGPSPASAVDRAFVLGAAAEDDHKQVARVREALTEWTGAPLRARTLDELLQEAADELFLRQHAEGGGIELYSIAGAMKSGAERFRLVAVGRVSAGLEAMTTVTRHVGPDTEAAAAGSFREGGCSRGFAAHAVKCVVCLEQLARVAATGELPAEFRALA